MLISIYHDSWQWLKLLRADVRNFCLNLLKRPLRDSHGIFSSSAAPHSRRLLIINTRFEISEDQPNMLLIKCLKILPKWI